jgi:membrane protease subunit HflC
MPGGIKTVIGLVVLVILAFILIPQIFFTVDETNQALVLRFGEFQRTKTSPGLSVKVPFIETVTKYDKRLLRFDAPPETLITLDKKNLIIDAYARYRITDAKVFFETVQDEAGADSRLRDIISGELKKQIASFNQSEIILTQRATGEVDGVPTIVQSVRDDSRVKARALGVEIIDIRIKRADFTDPIQQSIFQRMNAERQQEAALFRAEGAEFDFRIRATADRTRTITIANAQRDADIINGCGESVAVKIFASAFNQDPEFFNFLRSLEAYTGALGSQDTLVIPVNSEFFRYLTDFSGVLDGELPAGSPLGDAPAVDIGSITGSGESIVAQYTQDRINELIRECEEPSGFIKLFSGIIENVEVISVFEAGLTTTDIVWTVGGEELTLNDLETVILGDDALRTLTPSGIRLDDVEGREVDVVARREPQLTETGQRIRLAVEINFR